MTVYRPVKASPPQMNEVVIDPKTGKFTQAGHRRITELWKRTGGFTDDIGALIGLVTLSQVSALQVGMTEEKTRRILGDGLAQIQAQQTERLRSELDAYQRTTDAHFGQLLGALSQPPLTRVISFEADDTWRPAPGLRAVQVFAVGGGGGGGDGSFIANRAGGGGGAGGGYSLAYFNAEALPDSVSVTVGAGGASGAAGGNSSFGAFMVAVGGGGGSDGGATTGAAGAAPTTYGAMFFGGDGGAGTLTDGAAATNAQRGAPGGGGGGGYNNGAGGAGGIGSWRATTATGGGGAGGASGTNGVPGSLPVNGDVYIGPGIGGGGGGGATTGDGGNGAAGVIGGGGGGGGAIGTGGTTPGTGGTGGTGRVWVLELY